jgi:hypothetical protein
MVAVGDRTSFSLRRATGHTNAHDLVRWTQLVSNGSMRVRLVDPRASSV